MDTARAAVDTARAVDTFDSPRTIDLNLDIHYIHVDSKNRDLTLYPHGNNYVLHFVTPIKGAVKVDLVSARVPNTMYNFNDDTSSAALTTSITGPVSITQGFYSADTLQCEINARLDSKNEEMYYSAHEGKFYYLSDTAGETITVNSGEAARMLGFTEDKVYTVSLLSTPVDGFSYGVKSERIVDFSLNEYVFLDIEEFRGPFFSDLSNLNSLNATNMFAVIPMDVYSGQIKTFKETSDYVMTQNLSNHMMTLSRLTVHWYDKNLRSINFQGFENNGFVLRVYTQRTIEVPAVKNRPPVIDHYIREIKTRIEEESKEKEKKQSIKFGKWTVLFGILGILVFWYVTKKIA